MDIWGEYITGYCKRNSAICTYCNSYDTVTLCEHEKCQGCCECGGGGETIPPLLSDDNKYCDKCGEVWQLNTDSISTSADTTPGCSACGHPTFRVARPSENSESSFAKGKYCGDCGEVWKSCADGSNLGCWSCTDLVYRELNPDDQEVIEYTDFAPPSQYDNISYSRVNWPRPTLEASQQSAPIVQNIPVQLSAPELPPESTQESALVTRSMPEPEIVNDKEYEEITNALNRQVARGLTSATNADSDTDSDTDSEPDETPNRDISISDKIKNDIVMLRTLAPVALLIQEIYNLRAADGNLLDDAGDISLAGIRTVFKFGIENNAMLIKLPFMKLQIPIQIVCAPFNSKSNLDELCVYLKRHIVDTTGETVTNLSGHAAFKTFYGQLMQLAKQLAVFYRQHLVNIIPADYFDRLPAQITELHVNHVGPTLYLMPGGLHLHFEYMLNLVTSAE